MDTDVILIGLPANLAVNFFKMMDRFLRQNQNKFLFDLDLDQRETKENNFFFNFVFVREIMIFHLEQEILDAWISSQKMNTIYLFVQTLAILEFDFGFIFPWKIHNWINGV